MMTRALRLLAALLLLAAPARAQSINVGPSRPGGNPIAASSSSFPTVPTFVTSAQHGTITILNGNQSGTTTISAVDWTVCSLRQSGVAGQLNGGNNAFNVAARVYPNTNTSVGALVNTVTTIDEVVGFDVICFGQAFIKSIQRVNISGNGTTTITSVNTSKSMLNFLGYSSTAANFTVDGSMRVVAFLLNATTVSGAGTIDTTATTTVEIVEFN